MKILHKTDSEFIFPYFQLVERLGKHSIGFANCIYQILSSASEAELWRPPHTRFRVSLQKKFETHKSRPRRKLRVSETINLPLGSWAAAKAAFRSNGSRMLTDELTEIDDPLNVEIYIKLSKRSSVNTCIFFLYVWKVDNSLDSK